MLVTVTIADDLALEYQEEARERNLTIQEVVTDRVRRAASLDPRQRYIILEGRLLQRMEEVLGCSLMSAELTLAKVQRLARVKFGAHEIYLTPGQMEELQFRAKKLGQSMDQLLAGMWLKLSEEFFSHVP